MVIKSIFRFIRINCNSVKPDFRIAKLLKIDTEHVLCQKPERWRMYTVRMVCLLLICQLLPLSINAQRTNTKVDSLKDVYHTANHDSIRLQALYRLSGAFYPNYDSSKYYAQLLIDTSKKLGNKRYAALGTARLATLLAREGEYDKALEYSRSSLSIIEDQQNNKVNAQLYESMAYIYYLKQDYRQALEGYLKSLELAQTTGDKSLLPNLYITIGTIYSRIGKFDKSLEYYMYAIQYDDEGLLSKSSASRLYNNIGNQYQLLDKNDEALKYMTKAYEIKKELNSVPGQIVALRNMANICQKLNKLEEAEEKMLLALSLSTENPAAAHYISRLNISTGNLYVQMKEYEKARNHLQEAIDAAKGKSQWNDMATAYLNLGNLNFKLKQYDQARQNMLTAIELQPDTDDQIFLVAAYSALASLDSATGDFENSLKNYHIAKTLEDSLMSAEKNRTIAELEIAYETQKKDNEILLLKKDQEIEKSKSDRKTIIIRGFIIGVAFLLILLVLLYRQNRLKLRSVKVIEAQKDELEVKNRENQALIKEIHHRVRNNLQIMLSLLNAQSYTLEGDHRAKEIIKESQNRIKSMALIHQNLYKSGNYVMVESLSYFEDLVSHIKESFAHDGPCVKIKTHIVNKEIRMTMAVPLGLILNELITNAYKYAFPGMEKGEVRVCFEQQNGDNSFLLQVHDTGIGLDPDFELDQVRTFGLQMVKGLTEQLEGTVKISIEEGTKFDIEVSDHEME